MKDNIFKMLQNIEKMCTFENICLRLVVEDFLVLPNVQYIKLLSNF